MTDTYPHPHILAAPRQALNDISQVARGNSTGCVMEGVRHTLIDVGLIRLRRRNRLIRVLCTSVYNVNSRVHTCIFHYASRCKYPCMFVTQFQDSICDTLHCEQAYQVSLLLLTPNIIHSVTSLCSSTLYDT